MCTVVLEDNFLPTSFHTSLHVTHMLTSAFSRWTFPFSSILLLYPFFFFPGLLIIHAPFLPPHLFLKCGVSEHVTSAESLLLLGRPERLFGMSYSLYFWLVNQQQWLAFPQGTFTSLQCVCWEAPDLFWKMLNKFINWLRTASSAMSCRCRTVFSENASTPICGIF